MTSVPPSSPHVELREKKVVKVAIICILGNRKLNKFCFLLSYCHTIDVKTLDSYMTYFLRQIFNYPFRWFSSFQQNEAERGKELGGGLES
jgi:hypothetical protein